MIDTIEKNILDILRNLCDELSQENITIQQVADSIGSVSKENTTKMQFNIEPANPVFEEAMVVREVKGKDAPSYVELQLGEQFKLTLNSLENAFGPSRSVPRTAHRTGSRIAITYDISGRSYICTIFADLSEDGKDVTRIMVRRDVRLPD